MWHSVQEYQEIESAKRYIVKHIYEYILISYQFPITRSQVQLLHLCTSLLLLLVVNNLVSPFTIYYISDLTTNQNTLSQNNWAFELRAPLQLYNFLICVLTKKALKNMPRQYNHVISTVYSIFGGEILTYAGGFWARHRDANRASSLSEMVKPQRAGVICRGHKDAIRASIYK